MQRHRFTVKRHPVVLVKVKGGKRVGLSRDALPHGSWVRRQSPGFTFSNLSLPDPDYIMISFGRL